MEKIKLIKGKPLKVLNYYIDLLEIGVWVCKVSGKKFYDGSSQSVITDFIPHPITGKPAVLLDNGAFMDIRSVRPVNNIPEMYYNN